MAEPLEVHGQEGDVGNDIAVPESSLNSRQSRTLDTVVEAIDIVRLQVAVAVADTTVAMASVQQ